MSNVARKFSHTGPSQGALPLADRGRRIIDVLLCLFFFSGARNNKIQRFWEFGVLLCL